MSEFLSIIFFKKIIVLLLFFKVYFWGNVTKPDVHYTQLTCVSFLICIENDKFFFLLFFSEVYFLRCLNPRSRMLKDFIICCHVTTKNLFHTWLMIRQKQRTNAILGKNETSSHDDPRSFQGRLSAIRSLSIIIKR